MNVLHMVETRRKRVNRKCEAEREAMDRDNGLRDGPHCLVRTPYPIPDLWVCCRVKGHEGVHVATLYEAFLARWTDEDGMQEYRTTSGI